MSALPNGSAWPALPYPPWKDTLATLHMWAQIVGKVRLAQTPYQNHSWHVPLYLNARGLTTSTIAHGSRVFEIAFDFLDHALHVRTSDGKASTLRLMPRPVADVYRQLMADLAGLGLPVHIHTTPNEVVDAIPFEQDTLHASYDPDAANRFWQVLLQTERVMRLFRARFLGKQSPIHFFWGSCDLATTRFSGAVAPPHPGGAPHCPDRVMREAYSHEVSSCGFWPGGDALPEPVFYAYAYPAPPGYPSAPVQPAQARYEPVLGEFVLPYDAVRTSANPDATLLAFFTSTYEAAANLGAWNRSALEVQQ